MRKLALLALVLTAAACGSAEVPTASPVQPTPSPIVINLGSAALDPILADAAQRAGVDPSQLVVTRTAALVWPNGSFGCPEPGVDYPQVPIDGYWVLIDAPGQSFDYRGDAPGSFRLCPRGPEQQ